MTRRVQLFLALVAISCFWAPAAMAGQVQAYSDPVMVSLLMFDAAPGEKNHVLITYEAGAYFVIDSGAPLTVFEGCVSVDAHSATCVVDGTPQISVDLGDRDDFLSLSDIRIVPRVADCCNIPTLHGDGGDDTIIGSQGPDIIKGKGGDDTLRGRDSNYDPPGCLECDPPGCLTCQADDLYGGGGGDWIHGQDGRDLIVGGPGSDFLFGGRGGDLIRGSAGDDNLIGRGGHDRLEGRPGSDSINARDGSADEVRGGPGHDVARIDKQVDWLKDIEGFF